MHNGQDKRSSILITACSPGGIGNALAREFHQQGLRVFATARDTGALQSLTDLGIETLSLVVDDERSVQSCYAEVRARLGEKGLDYLVNNANGSYIIDYTVPAMKVDLAEAHATFETNLFAVINMCQTFLPLLKKAQGTIVQIGSVAGVIPYVFGSVYNASKAALHSFNDTLKVELAPFGVNVTTIVTGGVQSRIARVKRTLAPNSLYAPIEDEYNRRVMHSQDGAMPHTVYARSVVTQILYGTAPWIWEGNKSWLIWLLSGGWAWTGIFHYTMTRMFKLYKLRKVGEK
ncbi:hypothetical protein BDV27DRAFT_171450 [Aspergillus caelatus]|uniref:Short chain dehydrogenase/reductase n=1 Tax=Aspergillus caelatus TaxID=61420 RepID=A0A5N7A7L4_9EURO|nr:uncharacterized protein BDV27DRAFT_171450 [Aspergillus caelatus]KAE8365685.1 hypothetical protein BDV27DRAFT_171450 [Aspergillus caelatus]